MVQFCARVDGQNRSLVTVKKQVDIQQLLANLDTMSTLVRDTLVSRAEPPPSEWTDITLEQTYEY